MPSKTTSRSNVKQALKLGYTTLQTTNISSAWLDAEIIMATILKKDRAFVLGHEDYPLTTVQLTKFQKLIKRRQKHEPLAYLIGHKEFYGLDFKVTKATLVPRPESELIIDEALKAVNPKKENLIIDIGTGSGCLILTLLHELEKKGYSPNAIAVDISKKALEVATHNAKKLQTKNITFLKSNLLSSIIKKPNLLKNCTQLIMLANLPYLTKAEIRKEKSISQEPQLALDGGRNGLALYRVLSQQIKVLKNNKKIDILLVSEINPWQENNFKKIWPDNTLFKTDVRGETRIGITHFQ